MKHTPLYRPAPPRPSLRPTSPDAPAATPSALDATPPDAATPDVATPEAAIPDVTAQEATTPFARLLQTQARAKAADRAEREVVAMLAHRLYAGLLAYLGCDKKHLVLGIMVLPERQTYYDFMLLLRLDDGVEPRLTMRVQPGPEYELSFLTEEGTVLSRTAFPPPTDESDEARRRQAEAMAQCFADLVEALRHRLETQVRTWTEKRAIY